MLKKSGEWRQDFPGHDYCALEVVVSTRQQTRGNVIGQKMVPRGGTELTP